MLRLALAIHLKALPEGHPDIANSYNNLAVTLSAQGKAAEAEAMYRRGPGRSGLKALPEGHPTSPSATTTWPRPSGTRGSRPRPRPCTAALWPSG